MNHTFKRYLILFRATNAARAELLDQSSDLALMTESFEYRVNTWGDEAGYLSLCGTQDGTGLDPRNRVVLRGQLVPASEMARSQQSMDLKQPVIDETEELVTPYGPAEDKGVPEEPTFTLETVTDLMNISGHVSLLRAVRNWARGKNNAEWVDGALAHVEEYLTDLAEEKGIFPIES